LNDGVKGFMTDKMKFDEILFFSNLTVSSIDAEGLLAMKLTAARVNTSDMIDSIFLMKTLGIQKESELFDIIEKYTHIKQRSLASKYFTIEAFAKYQEDIKEHKLNPHHENENDKKNTSRLETIKQKGKEHADSYNKNTAVDREDKKQNHDDSDR